jgi:hypothetical protein
LENAVPVVLRVGGFKFFFFSDEGNEPVHIHVEYGDKAAKYWLCPVRLARNYGMKPQDLRKIREILEKNESMIQEKWDEFNSRKK